MVLNEDFEYTIGEKMKEKINHKLENNPFSVLSKIIYDALYQEVIDGHLNVNNKIVESKLAKDLNVSRTPVKMAIGRLIDEGILVKKGSKDVYVAKLTYEELLWLAESRLTLEKEAARIAALRISNNELVILKQLIKIYQEIDVSYNNEQFAKNDKRFHDMIVNASHNPYIIKMYRLLECPLQRYRHQLSHLAYEDIYEANGLERGSEMHNAIYRALNNHMQLEAQNAIANDVSRMYGTISMIRYL